MKNIFIIFLILVIFVAYLGLKNHEETILKQEQSIKIKSDSIFILKRDLDTCKANRLLILTDFADYLRHSKGKVVFTVTE